jgi:diamine N-acetyltransferase
MAEVSLRAVTRENVRAVCDLELAEGQQDLIAPAAFTVAEAHYEPGALLRAIYLGDAPVGVLLVEFKGHEVPYLVRFMIDGAHQGQGIGGTAIAQLLEALRAAEFTALEVSFNPRNGGAGPFWRGMGFEETGRITHGEPVARREL